MKNRNKVLILGYTKLNLGDDLFLDFIFNRYKNVDFYLKCEKKYERFYKGYNNVIVFQDNLLIKIIFKMAFITNLKLYKYIYRKFNEIKFNNFVSYVKIGGSIFKERINSPTIDDWNNLILSSVFKKRSSFILGSNFGPFNSKCFKEFYHNIFLNFTEVNFRDSYSYSLFGHLPNVNCFPDIIFGYKSNPSVKIKNTVGFSLVNPSSIGIDYEIEEAYFTAITNLANYYQSLNYNVRFFSFCEYEGDQIAIEKIVKNLDLNSNFELYLYDGRIELFLNEYSKTEVMYCTRFHSMILSLLFNQKFLSLAYSEKVINVINDLNLHSASVRLSDISKYSTQDLYTMPVEHKIDPINYSECFNHFSSLDKELNL